MATILISAPLPGGATAMLERGGHRLIIGESPYGLGREGLLASLRDAPETRAMITLLSDRVDRDVIEAAPALELIANYAVGVDNLDLELLRSRGVTVTNTPGVLTEATADLAFGLMLDACRRVSEGDRHVRQGAWRGWSPTLLLGKRVHGATLGIIGFGRIGQAMARRATGFSMTVIYHQRHRADAAMESELRASWVSLEELIERSDVVSLHCPLTPETRGLMSRERLGRMKQGAVLVNAGRGPCVDEEALAELLSSGHLFGAGLDVYASEPRVAQSLLRSGRVVLAPHLGSADEPTRMKMAEMCAEAVEAVLGGREPAHRVA